MKNLIFSCPEKDRKMTNGVKMYELKTSPEPLKPRYIPNRRYRMFFKIPKYIATALLVQYLAKYFLDALASPDSKLSVGQ